MLLFAVLGALAPAPTARAAEREAADDLPREIATMLARMRSLGEAGQTRAAAEAGLKALERCAKLAGPESIAMGTCCQEAGSILLDLGVYELARESFKGALALREKTLGATAPATIATLNCLAQACYKLGDLETAEAHFRKALAAAEERGNRLQTATTASNLSSLLATRGAFAEAETLLLRAREIEERDLGPQHQNTVTTMSNLASLYSATGNSVEAEKLSRKALEITEEETGGDSLETAHAASNLATVLSHRGSFSEAASLLRRALRIVEKKLPENHPDRATVVMNLAMLYWSMGDAAQALPLSRQAMKATESAGLPETADSGIALHNLGLALQASGDDAGAIQAMGRAFRLFTKILPLGHPQLVKTGSALAAVYQLAGNLEKADETMVQVGKSIQAMKSVNHPDVGSAFNNVGTLLLQWGKPADAVKMLEAALDIWTKTLGAFHPDTARCLSNLAFAEFDSSHPEKALDYSGRALAIREKILADIFSFGTEAQRSQFHQQVQPYTMPASLGNAPAITAAALHWKGIVLDSLREERALESAAPEGVRADLLRQLREARQHLQQLLLSTPPQSNEVIAQRRQAEIRHWEKIAAETEGSLASLMTPLGQTRRAMGLTAADVQSVLAPGEALIEFLRYGHYSGDGKFDFRYGALVLPPRGEIGWVPLGSADEIERSVRLYQKSVRGQTDEHTLKKTLLVFDRMLWQPVEKALPGGTRSIIIAPDAALNLVSFATLLDAREQFLAQRFDLRYVASGRDLLRKTKPLEEKRLALFGDPEFAAAGGVPPRSARTGRQSGHSVGAGKFQAVRLNPLPGTSLECERLGELATGYEWNVESRLRSVARESALFDLRPPRLLHFATHGFFLPPGDTAAPHPIGSGISSLEAMFRAGLALAGAQDALDAMGSNDPMPVAADDGLLTAEEVGTLNLHGTWLVALSACDTGTGEILAGEGVLGLRRGFVQAGAHNLLMTLWPINDEATVEIMLKFYEQAFQTGDAPGSLGTVQRDALVRLRLEQGLLRAVTLAGAFIMSSQGK